MGAAFLVSLVTIDLGPYLRGQVEREASAFLERPMHVGRLSAALRPGQFVLDDVLVEGLTADAAPFLKADRIRVSVPWWKLFSRELVIEVEMDGFAVTIEGFPGNRTNLPNLSPRSTNARPAWYSTVVDHVYARNGWFNYIDHAQPWDITCENVTVNFVRARNLGQYVATAGFESGLVHILAYEPMRLDGMSSRMVFDGPLIRVGGLDLRADGTRSHMVGVLDTEHWPEHQFDISTRFDVAPLKEIFFFGQSFTASGEGDFTGKYHKYQNGAYEIAGAYRTPRLTVNGLQFPRLDGHVVWMPNRLEVFGNRSEFYGGQMKLSYVLDTQGGSRGTVADLSATYSSVDLMAFGQAMGWQGLELASRADGWQTMTWPSGRFDQMSGDGEIRATPADGRTLAAAQLPDVVTYAPKEDPFIKNREMGPIPAGGVVNYRLTPETLTFSQSWAATPETHVTFQGTTGWHDNADMPFRVVSTDWQASDRLLAAIMTTFGSPTGAVEVGGRGTFDGRLTRWFSRPLIEGRFEGDGIRAWDVTWGNARGDVSIENAYATIANSLVGDDSQRLEVNGKYALGYPRADGGEELDARIKADNWPLTDFRHAFELDDWPVEGRTFADIRIYGQYEGPEGFGLMRVTPGSAWEEPFETFSTRLSFEGVGMRLDGAEAIKSSGSVRGAAYIGWPTTDDGWGTYSFTFDGEKIPVESLVSFTVPDADLTGVLNFTMSGSGSMERPRYDWDGRIADLFWGDEGIGQATAHMVVEEDLVTIDRLDVASDRLSISGSGQVAMTDAYDAEMTLRFSETSVDPYLRFVAPQLSPYSQAVASGSLRLSGELANLSRLGVDLTVDRADLKLFDYTLRNSEPMRFVFQDDVFQIRSFKLAGEGTGLNVSGSVNRATSALDVTLDGAANLAVLQGVVQDVRSSGDATVAARVTGTMDAPRYSGQATITDGRLRHFSFPHSLDEIHGAVTFDGSGISLDGLRARMGTGGRNGGGEIAFGGRIGLESFTLGRMDVTARGTGLDLRFPEGFRSTVDADVSLTGDRDDATLAGRITVRQARYTRRLQSNAGLLGFATGDSGGASFGTVATPTELPLSFNVELVGQRLLVIDDSDATIVVSPDLRLTGTIDQPVVGGRVDIDRGETEFLGNRYTVGGYLEFTNPDRIDPYFDIEARTQIRQPSQDYRLDLRFSGTLDRLTYELSSDPPLSQSDVLSLVLGQSPNLQRAELRALESPQDVQNQLMSSVLAQLVASPITTQVGRVVERTGLVDTFSVTPLFGPDATLQQLNPGARVTLGKRISSRVYLTYSRSLENANLNYEILLLEYAQNERMSWVLSRNEDGSFALDLRVRYRF